MAVIIKEKSAIKQVKELASKHGVKIDVETEKRNDAWLDALAKEEIPFVTSTMFNEADENKKPIVYVDMDGVLVDFFGEWANMHGVENWRDIAPLLKKQGKTINDALDAIRAKKDFWINLKPETGAKTLLATIKKYAGEYTILSSPLSNDPNSIPQKRAWVKNNLSAFPPKEVIIHKRKQDYATQADGTPNILIDDFSEQVKPWKAAGGIAFKHSNRQVTKTTDGNSSYRSLQNPH